MGVFNKTIMPLALVEYEMIIANSALRALLAPTTSYPTRTRGIIVKYIFFKSQDWHWKLQKRKINRCCSQMIIEKWFTYIIKKLACRYIRQIWRIVWCNSGVYIWVSLFLFITINMVFIVALKRGNPFRYPDKDLKSVKFFTVISLYIKSYLIGLVIS